MLKPNYKEKQEINNKDMLIYISEKVRIIFVKTSSLIVCISIYYVKKYTLYMRYLSIYL